MEVIGMGEQTGKKVYASDYQVARSVGAGIVVLGWAVVILGMLVAAIGLVQDGDKVKIVAVALGSLVGGSFIVASGQITRAVVDVADYARQILAEVKKLTGEEEAPPVDEPRQGSWEE